MNPSELVSKLTRPLSELDPSIDPKSVVMAALNWPSQGWVLEALDWLDQGFFIDAEIANALESVAATRHYLQSTRHKAFAVAKRRRKQQASTDPMECLRYGHSRRSHADEN